MLYRLNITLHQRSSSTVHPIAVVNPDTTDAASMRHALKQSESVVMAKQTHMSALISSVFSDLDRPI
jgi:hypothetical protein